MEIQEFCIGDRVKIKEDKIEGLPNLAGLGVGEVIDVNTERLFCKVRFESGVQSISNRFLTLAADEDESMNNQTSEEGLDRVLDDDEITLWPFAAVCAPIFIIILALFKKLRRK